MFDVTVHVNDNEKRYWVRLILGYVPMVGDYLVFNLDMINKSVEISGPEFFRDLVDNKWQWIYVKVIRRSYSLGNNRMHLITDYVHNNEQAILNDEGANG